MVAAGAVQSGCAKQAVRATIANPNSKQETR
jgi:hypothetical protein